MEPREYEEIIRQLIDLMEEGVYIVDKDGVGLFYSQKMAANEGLTVSDVVGKEYHKVFPGIPLSESTMYMALRKGVAIRKREQTYTNLYGKEITTINSTVPVKVDGQTVAAIEVANDITNFSCTGTRRVDINVSASYDVPVSKVLAALEKAGNVDGILADPAIFTNVTAYGDHAIQYVVRVWCPSEIYWDVHKAITLKIKDVFDEDGIVMTYPHLNVHLDK